MSDPATSSQKPGFAPLSRPRRLSDEVARQIAQRIEAGILSPGTQLPTEAELTREFGVGRSAVREALARLRQDGMVEARQGVGVFVCAEPGAGSFRIETEGFNRAEDFRHVMELRVDMEIAGAAMAARRRSAAQLAEMDKAFEELKTRLHANEDANEARRAFHRAMSVATNNPHYRDFMQFLASRIAVSLSAESTLGGRAGTGRLIREYAEILEGVRSGDPDRARRAAWNHLLRTADRLGLRGLQGWEESRMTLIDESTPPLCAPADPEPRRPRLAPPPGACDCHAHIFGPEDRYPFSRHRTYTPPPASLDSYGRLMDTLGLDRAVIVQPSVYGTDNRATLDAVQAGCGKFRGVVVIDENLDRREMERMHDLGVRGVRVNLLFKSGIEVSDVRRLAEKIAPFGWHLQMLVDVSEFADIRTTLGQLPVDVVFDHMGHMPTSIGTDHPGFRDMLHLLETGRAWVKLSGAYRITAGTELPYEDVAPFARAIVKANPERVLWASDWPHPYVNIPMPNDGALLDLLEDWTPDTATRDRILRDNPQRLYGFDD